MRRTAASAPRHVRQRTARAALRADSMRRMAAPALLLAAALAGGARPADGQDAGSRDPFADPFRGSAAPEKTVRPRGLAGVDVDALTLHGLVRIGGGYVAVVESADGRSHLLRGGERLFDGTVRSVTAEGVEIVRRGRGGADGRAVRLRLGAAETEER